MSGYTLLLICAWVLGSGVVAYVCDNLGRKLGKRRLSLWGLRPRHTAMVVTVLTGIGIALLTFALASLVSLDFRRAVFELGAIDQQVETLNQEQGILKASSLKLAGRNLRLQDIVSVAEQQAGTSRTAARLAGEALRHARDQREAMLRTLDAAEARLTALRRSREALARQVKERQSQLAALKSQLAAATQATTQAQRERGVAEQAADTLRRRISATTQTLATLKGRLNENQAELSRTESDLIAGRKELARVREDLEAVRANSLVIRSTPVMFATGQEIARRVIYQPSDPAQVEKELDKLMNAAETEARRQGARPTMPGEKVVRLVPLGVLDLSGLSSNDRGEETLRKLYAQSIVANGGDVVVRVIAGANAVENDPVHAYLEVAPNLKVFSLGERLLSDVPVDGRLSEAKVLEQIISVLQTQVRQKALDAGLLPPPSGAVGEINWEQVLQAVRDLQDDARRRSQTGRAKAGNDAYSASMLNIYAVTDVYTADPLIVRFSVG